jgi:hypothetical protein
MDRGYTSALAAYLGLWILVIIGIAVTVGIIIGWFL